jgi:hypothetical protein
MYMSVCSLTYYFLICSHLISYNTQIKQQFKYILLSSHQCINICVNFPSLYPNVLESLKALEVNILYVIAHP